MWSYDLAVCSLIFSHHSFLRTADLTCTEISAVIESQIGLPEFRR